AEHGLL
ncbi:hypothetical protein ECEC1868_3018, partial [Escherichia coli EC1868]